MPTSRVKNTETILEKLRRGDGSGLKSIQDLAGMRIVGDFDRRGDPLEIQVRTRWQFFEKLADLVGRGIRYGEPPSKRVAGAGVESASARASENAEREARVILVSMAHTAAELIAVLEAADAERPRVLRVAEYRDDIANLLAELNRRLADLRRYEDEILPPSSL